MKRPTSSDPILRVIRRRRRRLAVRSGYADLLFRIVFLALAGWLLLTQVFLPVRTAGNDMFPAIKDGDLLLAFRLQTQYIKGDVVVYAFQGERKIGRLVADEGDHVTMDGTGTLLVNGAVQTGDILYPTHPPEDQAMEIRVPEGHVYLLGDHRPQAVDSREHGPVPKADVEGKVITLLRRRGL